MKKIFKNEKGFSLVEILVSVLLVSAFTVTVFTLVIHSIKVTANNKYILSAKTLVNKKLEYIRSLPYDDIGTISGAVNGIIPDSEDVTNNNGHFTIDTYINYIDDDFDGTDGGSPSDSIPNDYKTARVKVSWSGSFGDQSISGYTNIAPRGVETALGGGTLAISVHDANGLPVEDALIDIFNDSIAPMVDIEGEYSNSIGVYKLFGALESIEGYEISVTKEGYSVDATYPRTATNTNPTKPHATVLDSLRTDISFAIDLLSDLSIDVVTANLPSNFGVGSDAAGEDQSNSRIIIDPSGNIYVIWQDFTSSGDAKIHAQKYNSSGVAQWNSGDDVVVGTANQGVLPDIEIDSSGNLYACWGDDSGGNQEIYAIRLDSNTGIKSWTGEEKIETAASSDDQMSPRLKISEDNGNTFVNIVFQDNRNGEFDIFVSRLDASNGSPVWVPSVSADGEVAVSSDTLDDGTNQYAPYIDVSSGEELFIVWTDERDGKLDVYAQKFASSGIAIWPNDLMIPTQATSSDQLSPSTAIDIDSLDKVYVVWADDRNGDYDIYAQKYDIDGNALWANDVKLNSDTGSADQTQPAIAIDSNNDFFVVWADERNGNQDIYGQKFNSNGSSTWSVDMRINIDTGTYNQYNPDISINPTNDMPYITWESDDGGDLNIYASSFGDYSSETDLDGIDVQIRGEKRIGENPIIYKYEETHTSDASGDIILNNIEWDSYSFFVDATSTGYTLVMTIPPMPLNLDPDTSSNIKLYLK